MCESQHLIEIKPLRLYPLTSNVVKVHVDYDEFLHDSFYNTNVSISQIVFL